MWKNLWALLESLTNTSNRLTRLEKDLEALEKENRDQNKEIQNIWMQLGRLIERENWREEKLRQEMEIERVKTENERLKLEIEMERQRLSLPPATTRKDDQS